MVQTVSGTSRNLTCDSWYTSVPLAKALLDKHKITLIGTLRKNKREIPPEFLPSRHRPAMESLFGFYRNMTLVSYVPARSRASLLLSTMHNDASIDPVTTGDRLKPTIVTDYNKRVVSG